MLSPADEVANSDHTDCARGCDEPTTESRGPLVSVCLITYQHEPFIGQALESVLSQKTSFPVEICIGEDGSTDGTREVCLQYAQRHPDRIRLFLRDRRDVIFVNGRPTGRRNLVETLRACRGRYVALLEGDDYWTSSHKLQKQFEILESDPEVSLCSHGVTVIDSHGHPIPSLDPYRPRGVVVPLTELLEGMVLPTASLFFRNWGSWDFPHWFYSLPMGDWPLAILCALRGRVVFLPEKMAAYRRHAGGQWSTRDSLSQVLASEAFYDVMRGFLGPRYHRKIRILQFQTRAHRFYLEGHLWRSRYFKYLAAAYRGPQDLLGEVRATVRRLLSRHSGASGQEKDRR